MKQTANVAESAEKDHVQKPVAKQLHPQSQPGGNSWQFYFVITVILIGLIGLVGKTLGLF